MYFKCYFRQDCGGLVCLNGGTLDLKACTCTCKRPFNVQPNCALNCEVAVDPTHCKTRYTGLCEVYSNVPYDCPNMCKWCPNAVTVSTTAVSTTAVSSTTVSTTAVSSTTVSSTTSVTTPSPLSSPVVLTSSAPSATATSTTKQDAKFLK
ncbi:uncharacterized protein DDB_G0290587-like [Dreissena polymorpha]|uniref:ShKT domain-containing protein n=1 Tax=Dreissena polymorpha TaxID=45954 RepID=A0A9D4QVI0_DREPO|nr:uncharacterized protein DDB_G0290587-like [Dreissena polymorpha]KAH3844528.1 hypothetical protein DPMN_086787 [Dreissena polymorpha]